MNEQTPNQSKLATGQAKIIIGVIIIAVIAVSYLVYRKSNQPAPAEPAATEPVSEEVIKIGVILPLTGNQSAIGGGLRDALLLAQEELKNTRYKYELIFEDDQNTPRITVSAVNKLVNIDSVDVLISEYANTGNIVSPIADENKIVHFGIAFDPLIAKGNLNFIHWLLPQEGAKVFIEELKSRNVKKLGVFRQNSQGPKSIYDALLKQIEGSNIEIVSDQVFQTENRDFRSIIKKANESSAEIYLLLAFPPEIDILAKQVKEVGVETPITSILYFELSKRRELFNNYWYVNTIDPTDEFIKKFEDKYNKNVVPGAANGYDVFKLVVAVCEKIELREAINSEIIAEKLKNIKKFNSALGNLSIGEDGIIWSKAVVKMIKDGKPITISD